MPISEAMSRRAIFRKLSAITAAVCGIATAARAQEFHPQEQVRLLKAAARYQDQPKGDESCGSCPYFIVPGRCLTVEGDISPNGWCPMYTRFSPLDRGAHL